jgi:hypothetical protein
VICPSDCVSQNPRPCGNSLFRSLEEAGISKGLLERSDSLEQEAASTGIIFLREFQDFGGSVTCISSQLKKFLNGWP